MRRPSKQSTCRSPPYGGSEAREPMMRAVVVAGGPPGDDDFVRATVSGADLVIAADAGVLLLERLGIRPDLAVGDFDTAGPETLAHVVAQGIETETHPAAKDYTDTHLAIVLAIGR